MAGLVGPLNANLRLVEAAFPDARIMARGNEFTIEGEGADQAGRLIEELRLLAEAGTSVDAVNVLRIIDMVQHDERPSEVLTFRCGRRYPWLVARVNSRAGGGAVKSWTPLRTRREPLDAPADISDVARLTPRGTDRFPGHDDLHAPVLLTSGGRTIGRHGLALAEARSANHIGGDSLPHQIGAHRFGAAFA